MAKSGSEIRPGPSFLLLLRQPSRNGEEPAIIPRRMDGKVLVLLVLLLLLGLAQYVAPLLLLLLQLPPFSQAGPPLLPPLTQDFAPSNSRLRFSASLPLSPSPPVPASGEYSAILPPSSPEYPRAAGRKPEDLLFELYFRPFFPGKSYSDSDLGAPPLPPSCC